MTWVAALVLTIVALPPLITRLAGGYPPNPVPELAHLAPLAVVPAVAAVIVAAFAAWWLAVPAAVLVAEGAVGRESGPPGSPHQRATRIEISSRM